MDLEPGQFDQRAQTVFVRRTSMRALTPRARRRVGALIEMERLLRRYLACRSFGPEGHLFSSLAREFPVSHRAIELELRGHGPQNIVHLAERIELGFWTPPERGRRHRGGCDG